MAAIINFVCAIVFLCLVGKGTCQCPLTTLTISQAQTGVVIQNKPEWNMTITNTCTCTQLDVKIGCDGFQTVESIDPSVVAKSGPECLVNNGQPIYASTTFNFTYAWDTSFPFSPLSSTSACS